MQVSDTKEFSGRQLTLNMSKCSNCMSLVNCSFFIGLVGECEGDPERIWVYPLDEDGYCFRSEMSLYELKNKLYCLKKRGYLDYRGRYYTNDKSILFRYHVVNFERDFDRWVEELKMKSRTRRHE